MRHPVILTDIEGTTSSITFVKDVLFPYARERIAAFVRERAREPQVAAQIAATAREAGIDADDLDAVSEVLVQWIDEDRKATPLKALQGMVWQQGYESGAFVAHVYPDAYEALQRFHAEGRQLYVYSSGSVAAQRLYFAHTTCGDLTPLFSGYFDTTIGGKREAASYRRIAGEIGSAPGAIVFFSDIEAELDAAAEAGMATRLLRREGDGAPSAASRHPASSGFDEVEV
ncbi:MAG TPA: acireductone synthase [Candidatus Saccharimonadia bacterium]|nr:acireductone synthase [Candidatus Saccharimonadia bacterium]